MRERWGVRRNAKLRAEIVTVLAQPFLYLRQFLRPTRPNAAPAERIVHQVERFQHVPQQRHALLQPGPVVFFLGAGSFAPVTASDSACSVRSYWRS